MSLLPLAHTKATLKAYSGGSGRNPLVLNLDTKRRLTGRFTPRLRYPRKCPCRKAPTE